MRSTPYFLRLPVLLLALAGGLVACRPPATPEPDVPAAATPGAVVAPVELDGQAWVESTLAYLTLEQKVSQLFSVPAPGGFGATDSPAHRKVRELVRDLQVGGVIFFQGTPLEQAAFSNELQASAPIPLLISQDMEWGAGMRLTGATRLPTAMAIAATRDASLAYEAGLATGREARAVGVRQVLAPVADVNANSGNPVIDVRSFSDQPILAAGMVDAFVRGLQASGVLATVKHFPGHGATSRDSHFSMPVLDTSWGELNRVDLVPFRAAIEAGAASVMTAHVSYPALDGGRRRPATLARPITSGILRDSLRFEGLVVSDALNMAGVSGDATAGSVAVDALRAGVDMLLMSTDVYGARRAILEAVRSGQLTENQIDAKVRRILTAKARAGLHENRFAPLDNVRTVVANATQRITAGAIARNALTLLGDTTLSWVSDRPGRRILVLTLWDRSDPDKVVSFQDQIRERLPDATLDFMDVEASDAQSYLSEAANRAGRADDVVVGLFSTASSWRSRSAPVRQILSRIATVRAGYHLAVFGTPYAAAPLPGKPAIYLAYGDGPAEIRAVADALTARADIGGKLPVSIPGGPGFGSGAARTARFPRLAEPEEVEMDGDAMTSVDSLIQGAIGKRAFPGAAVAVGRKGAVVLSEGIGYYTYGASTPVTEESLFDLASLTKVIATTTAVMQLYDQGRIDLESPVARYVVDFGQNGKEAVTIRQLLTHTGGLIPFRPFYSMGLRSKARVMQAIYEEPLAYEPGTDSRYSDFGPIVLAEVVERVTGMDFATYARRRIFEPLGMWHTGFRPVGRGTVPEAVPTENDEYFRFKQLQGEVHDENAWIMGGVAGHAGLFSTTHDLARFANMLISEGMVGGRPFVKKETLELFTSPADSSGLHTRALGWDTRTLSGYSSAGQYFGPRSFGHTGFTGTSMWFDPDSDVWVILLTNRVYPTRNNRGHIPVRPALADIVHETIRSEGHAHLAE